MLLSQLAMALALMAAATVGTLVWQWQRVEKFLRWVAMVVLTKKLRAKVSIDALILRAWSFEMHGLLISNGPGAWEAPYALQLPRLRVEFTCCMGLLSTIFPPTLRLGRYEFHLGFRIKEVASVDVNGLSIFLEDADDEASITPLRTGVLRKRPVNGGFGASKSRHFVLTDTKLQWFLGTSGVGPARGTLKLFPSSSVASMSHYDSDGQFRLEVVSGKDELTLLAASTEERDEWIASIRFAIRQLRNPPAGFAWPSNATWIGVLAAEADAKKTRRRLQAQRRRRQWQKHWHNSEADHDPRDGDGRSRTSEADHDPADAAASGSCSSALPAHASPGAEVPHDSSTADAPASPESPRDVHELRSRLFANRHANRLEFIDSLQDMARGATLFVERSMSNVSEFRVDEAIEWQVGRVSFHGLSVTLNQQHTLSLGDRGWEMRGFVGSELDLKGRLFLGATVAPSTGAAVELGLAATVLRDSGSAVVAETVKHQVEEFVHGAQAKGTEAVQAVGKTAAAVAAGAAHAKAAIDTELQHKKAEVGRLIGEGVKKYTEKDQYEIGDLTKATLAKLGKVFKGEEEHKKQE